MREMHSLPTVLSQCCVDETFTGQVGQKLRSHRRVPGGFVCTAGAQLWRLGFAWQAVTSIGQDHFGNWLREHIGQFTPYMHGVQVCSRTTKVNSVVELAGADRIILDRDSEDNEWAHLTSAQQRCLLSSKATLVGGSLSAQLLDHVIRISRTTRALLYLNPTRWNLTLESDLSSVSVVQLSEADSQHFTIDSGCLTDLPQELLRRGVACVLVTSGSQPLTCYQHGAEPFCVAIERVTPRRTSGAGDCFAAAAFSSLISTGVEAPHNWIRFAALAAAHYVESGCPGTRRQILGRFATSTAPEEKPPCSPNAKLSEDCR